MKKNKLKRVKPVVIGTKFHMVCPLEDICTKCKWHRTKNHQANKLIKVHNCKKMGSKWISASSFFRDPTRPWWNTLAIPKACPYKKIFTGRIKLEHILI